jgi:hypothetical protein
MRRDDFVCNRHVLQAQSQTPSATAEPTMPSRQSQDDFRRYLESLKPTSAIGIDAVIELESPVYTLGEPVRVRVGFKNNSGRATSIIAAAPLFTVALTVVGPDGTPLRAVYRDVHNFISTHGVPITPGTTHYAEWELQQWYGLDHWGYSITKPGRYTITASPLPSGHFISGTVGRSAMTAFTVKQ